MAVVEVDLDGVVSYLRGGLRAGLGLEHRQDSGGCGGAAGERLFLCALVIARGARTIIPKIREIEMAFVAIGPRDVHTRARFHVNLYGGRFFALIDWYGHGGRVFSFQFSVVS